MSRPYPASYGTGNDPAPMPFSLPWAPDDSYIIGEGLPAQPALTSLYTTLPGYQDGQLITSTAASMRALRKSCRQNARLVLQLRLDLAKQRAANDVDLMASALAKQTKLQSLVEQCANALHSAADSVNTLVGKVNAAITSATVGGNAADLANRRAEITAALARVERYRAGGKSLADILELASQSGDAVLVAALNEPGEVESLVIAGGRYASNSQNDMSRNIEQQAMIEAARSQVAQALAQYATPAERDAAVLRDEIARGCYNFSLGLKYLFHDELQPLTGPQLYSGMGARCNGIPDWFNNKPGYKGAGVPVWIDLMRFTPDILLGALDAADSQEASAR